MIILISKNGINNSNLYKRKLLILKELCSIKNDSKRIISLFLKLKLWKREY